MPGSAKQEVWQHSAGGRSSSFSRRCRCQRRWCSINELLLPIHSVVGHSVVLAASKQQASKQKQALKQQQLAFCSGRTEQFWHMLNNTGMCWTISYNWTILINTGMCWTISHNWVQFCTMRTVNWNLCYMYDVNFEIYWALCWPISINVFEQFLKQYWQICTQYCVQYYQPYCSRYKSILLSILLVQCWKYCTIL